MNRNILLVVFALTACEKAKGTQAAHETPAVEQTHVAADEPAPLAPAAETPTSVDTPANRALTEEYVRYVEDVMAIMRDKPSDCDSLAKRLEPKIPIFADLGVRLMTVKEQMKRDPEGAKLLEAASDPVFESMMKRNPDSQDIIARASQCEKSSVEFKRIAPQVMMSKK